MRPEKAIRASALVVAVGLSIGLSSIAVAQGASRGHSGTFISFAVPEAQGTSPAAINPAGQIVGSYFESFEPSNVTHGFLWDRDGTITVIDFPGAPLTFVAAINPAGQIAGGYVDANNVEDGFVRDRN